MKKISILSLACAIALFGCGGSDGDSDTGGGGTTPTSTSYTVTTSDYYTGTALAGVSIEVALTTGSDTTVLSGTTNSAGEITFDIPNDVERIIVNGDVDSYGAHSYIVSMDDQTVDLFMQPVSAALTVTPTIAQDLAVSGVNVVSLAANSLVDDDGNAPTGTVNAEITVIDPGVDPDLMPGNFETLDTATGEAGSIESFGAVNVTFQDASGTDYDLAAGQTATVRIPLASNTSTPPATIPLYYFDESTGYWVEDGTATLVNNSYYEGEVTHFTTWNADYLYESIAVTGCVQDSEGNALRSVRVQTQGQDYSGTATTWTNSSGEFSVSARPSSQVLLTVETSQGLSRARSITTSTTDYAINGCIVLGGDSTATSATVTLTWGENPRDLDTQFIGPNAESGDGTFLLNYQNTEVNLNGSTMWLDVDDTSSYGPEITTIESFPFPGTYHYAVYHYSGTSDIGASPGRVRVDVGDDTLVYAPPSGDATVCWAVFDFVVDSSGGVTVNSVGTWQDRSYCYPSTTDNSTETTTEETATSLQSSSLVRDLITQKYYAK